MTIQREIILRIVEKKDASVTYIEIIKDTYENIMIRAKPQGRTFFL